MAARNLTITSVVHGVFLLDSVDLTELTQLVGGKSGICQQISTVLTILFLYYYTLAQLSF